MAAWTINSGVIGYPACADSARLSVSTAMLYDGAFVAAWMAVETSKPAASSLLRSASVSSIGIGGRAGAFVEQRTGMRGASPRMIGSGADSALSAFSA